MTSTLVSDGNGQTTAQCCKHGPGYASPLDAYRSGSREKILYVPCIDPNHTRPDYLATIDVDPSSSTYSTVIHRLPLGINDELHHSGWNACSSCFDDPSKSRSLLILPALGSGNVYAVDTNTNPRAPQLYKTVRGEDIAKVTGLTYLHSTHCLGSGDIMISAMGDQDGNANGGFLLLDETLNIKPKTWNATRTSFGYDYWYQPRHDVMVSTGWGSPKAFSKGFDPEDLEKGLYAHELYIWSWSQRKLVQTIDLGNDGLVPLEVRFLHDPSKAHGYVGAALSSNVIHFTKKAGETTDNTNDGVGEWVADPVIKQPWVKVENWVLPELPPLITDILISLDDKYLYFSNWLRGDVVQYDITDPANPKLAGRLWLGGVARRGGNVKVLGGLPEDVGEQLPQVPTVKGKELQGGPQMIQLSLDGKRLYVTNSLYSPWDKQFYPDLVNQGSYLLKIDVDSDHGGLSLDTDFYVDFGAEPGGPVLAHEVRYPGGDCSSDIWL